MSFVDRKKQAHLWRDTPKVVAFPTAEEILTGVVLSVTDRAIEKAAARLRMSVTDFIAKRAANLAKKSESKPEAPPKVKPAKAPKNAPRAARVRKVSKPH